MSALAIWHQLSEPACESMAKPVAVLIAGSWKCGALDSLRRHRAQTELTFILAGL